jgi:diguanylate cyclase (GGDEF)-like protein/PAS domain S-box-containing protein
LDNLALGINQMASELQQDRLLLESRIAEATRVMKEKKEEAERASEENSSLNTQLQTALNEVETIIEANPDILYVLNADGELIKWNSHLKLFSGLSSAQLKHRHVSNFFAQEDRAAVENWILQMLTHGAATIEAECIRHDGARVPYFCNGVVLHGQDGTITGFTGTGRDITERRLAAERMRHMAHFDALTNLPNRALLADRLQLALASAKREQTKMALMFLDLDEFKPVNDRLGHHMGDILLKQTAMRMRDCVRQSDTVARIGGDEFVIMLPLIDKREDTQEVAEKIRLALTAPFDLGGEQVRISCSIGIALYPQHGADEHELMRHADSAMYNAKQCGRNQTRWYEHDMPDNEA